MSIALREDDVVDSCRIDLRALDQRLQDDGAEFAGAHRRQAAAELADGGADRGDDGGAAQGHFGSPVTIGNGLNRHPGLDPGSRSATVKSGTPDQVRGDGKRRASYPTDRKSTRLNSSH